MGSSETAWNRRRKGECVGLMGIAKVETTLRNAQDAGKRRSAFALAKRKKAAK
jgi:hypothetical protein